MNPDEVAAILAWIPLLTGYPALDATPPVVMERAAYFDRGVVARLQEGVIHVRERITPDSWIFHEGVHAAQQEHPELAPATLCEREAEAYAAQRAYLLATYQLGFPKVPACTGKESE